MLKRQLLYTGVTRAKKRFFMIDSKQAFYMAVNNNEIQERYTGLLNKLKNINYEN